VGTPYEGKSFQLKLVFTPEFPAAPPKGHFLTKIYHPNVDMSNGAICVNTLKKDWTSDTTLRHVLSVIRCLLIVPFPESSLNDEAGKLFMESYQEYAKRARLMADIHGRPKNSDVLTLEKSAEEENEGCRPANLTPSVGDRSLKAVNRSSTVANSVKSVDKAKKKSLRRL
jgi:ubiquitin-conjugating enzyme E2 S